jgi:hypothetical protein
MEGVKGEFDFKDYLDCNLKKRLLRLGRHLRTLVMFPYTSDQQVDIVVHLYFVLVYSPAI